MSAKNVNNYKYKTFCDIFGQLHKKYSYEKPDSEDSAKWKEIKEKPGKINELTLETKADLKEKYVKGLQWWAKFMVTKPKTFTSSSILTFTLSVTSVTTSVTTTTITDDSSGTGASSTSNNQELLQSKDKYEK